MPTPLVNCPSVPITTYFFASPDFSTSAQASSNALHVGVVDGRSHLPETEWRMALTVHTHSSNVLLNYNSQPDSAMCIRDFTRDKPTLVLKIVSPGDCVVCSQSDGRWQIKQVLQNQQVDSTAKSEGPNVLVMGTNTGKSRSSQFILQR